MLFPEAMMIAAADRAACRALLRTGSRTFFAASHLLPRRVREPATALYAFCRLADDAIDLASALSPAQGVAEGSHQGRWRGRSQAKFDGIGSTLHPAPLGPPPLHGGGSPRDALDKLRLRLDRAYRGTPLAYPADRAFAATVAEFAIPRELPEALLEGLAWDAEGRRYATLADLHDYAARVAGSVGAMMTLVMGVRDPAPLARACALGAAMQLTNIARDVGEDARAGRLYLPLCWMRAAGLDPESWLAEPVFSPALASVVKRLLDEADRLYAAAEEGISALPLSCRVGIRSARLLYAEIGQEVARNGYDSVNRRARVPARRKFTLLVAAMRPRLARTGAIPNMTASAFLIAAVSPTSGSRDRSATIGDQVIWVLELFKRVERRRQIHGGVTIRS